MKTYQEDGAGKHGTRAFWKSLTGIFKRWIDRERELASLRNAVGMMSEARRADAREWHDMAEALRESRAISRRLTIALEEIGGSVNLTATPQQWAEHLQREARKAIGA